MHDSLHPLSRKSREEEGPLSPVRSCEIRLSSLTALDQALCVVYVEVARREESSSYEF